MRAAGEFTSIFLMALLFHSLLAAGCDRIAREPSPEKSGYVSLVFEVEDRGQSDPELCRKTMAILRRRVDPRGEHNLLWRVDEQNRIEVRMPLPSVRVRKLHQDFLDARDTLLRFAVTREQIEAALQLSEGRSEALASLAAGVPQRARLLSAAAAAFDARHERRAASQATTAASARDGGLTGRGAEIAAREAEFMLYDAIAEVLETSFPLDRFDRLLERGADSRFRAYQLSEWYSRFPWMREQLSIAVERYDAWRRESRLLENPEDLKRMLRGVGVLEFRILVEPSPEDPTRYGHYRESLRRVGPARRPDDELAWFRIDDPIAFLALDSPAELRSRDVRHNYLYVIDTWDEDYYVLAKVSPEDGLLAGPAPWKLTKVEASHDEHGRPCVLFELDEGGGKLFGELTSENIGKALCILIDDVAYSAPRIRSRIGRKGVITGEFTLEKTQYLVRTLEAGQLPLRLKWPPVSERTVLPQSENGGAD